MAEYTTVAAQRWRSLKRPENRRSIRHGGCNEVVKVNLRGGTWDGRLVNVSREGLAVLLPDIVTSGAKLEFACESIQLAGYGTVRHVHERHGQYMIGIQFQPGTEWLPATSQSRASGDFWKWDWNA